MAFAGTVLGGVSLTTLLDPLIGWFVAFAPPILAVIFGHMGRAAARRTSIGNGPSLVSLFTGYAALALPIAYVTISGVVGIVSKD